MNSYYTAIVAAVAMSAAAFAFGFIIGWLARGHD